VIYDMSGRLPHPIHLAAALLRLRPVSKRGLCHETQRSTLMRQAACMIRDQYNELEKLKKELLDKKACTCQKV
jgi:hypothetical protein